MNQQSVNSIYNRIRNVTVAAHNQLSGVYQLNIMWKMFEQNELPPKEKISVYSYLEVYTDNQVGFSSPSKLYRARGSVVQEIMIPKYDNAFRTGIVLTSNLQHEWRKQREENISYYDPMIYPDSTQPEQSFLQWNCRVSYDVFETI